MDEEETEAEWAVELDADEQVVITVADNDNVEVYTLTPENAAYIAAKIFDVLNGECGE